MVCVYKVCRVKQAICLVEIHIVDILRHSIQQLSLIPLRAWEEPEIFVFAAWSSIVFNQR